LWDELDRICATVGTAAPDRVVAGIDHNFFVTKHPVTVAASSDYRVQVENDLFGAEQVHATVGISDRIQAGFREFAGRFVAEERFRDLQTAHSRLEERVQAMNVHLSAEEVSEILAGDVDCRWYRNVEAGPQIDRYMGRSDDVVPDQVEIAVVSPAWPGDVRYKPPIWPRGLPLSRSMMMSLTVRPLGIIGNTCSV
jgi:hypothetical protein